MSFPYDCTQVVDIADEPHHHLVIANQYVRAFAVEVPPNTRTLCHQHPNEYLLYVASGAEIISAARDEEPKRLSYVDGECELSKAGLVHVVENLGNRAFRNVVVEALPAAGLKRAAKPRVTAGEAMIESLLEEVPGAVFRVALDCGVEVEVAGPAVLAAPYQPIMLREVDAFDIPLDDFRKLTWVCAPRKVAVRSAATSGAVLVAFQLGSMDVK